MTRPPKLVNIADYGLQGINFYWTRRERFELAEKDLQTAGVFDGHAYLHPDLIIPLQQAAAYFQNLGYSLIIKDAYRSPKLYKLIQERRYVMRGKEETDQLLNMQTMPHSTGRAVDVNLIDLPTNQEVKMRNPAEDPAAFFINFYRDKSDATSQEYQRLQQILIAGMLASGFVLGSKQEFWHFEYPSFKE